MFDFSKIFARHEIDAWRDEQTLAAATVLNQLAADLAESFEDELQAASWKDGLIGPAGFIATQVAPKVRETAEPVISRIMNRANAELQRIVAHQAVWNDIARHSPDADDPSTALYDVAFVAGPLTGGLAAAAAVPTMAVTTTSAFFGLVTTTAISWPVVVVGSALAGAGIATGLLNASRLWAKADKRLRKRVHAHVVAVLLQGSSKQPAVLEQLAALFERTAAEAKKI